MSDPNKNNEMLPGWLSNDRKLVLVQVLVWLVVGMGGLIIAWSTSADDGLLWVLAATVLLSYSALSGVLGIFVSRWLRYFLLSLLGYLILAGSMAMLLSQVSLSPGEELSTYPGMYAAFLMSFFLINGVAGAVRKIAFYTGME